MTASYNLSLLGSNYNQGGSGAVARTTASKLQESVSVLDFGADPTGVADSTTAIQGCVDAAWSARRDVFIPGGTYLVTGITLPGTYPSLDQRDHEIRIYGNGYGNPFTITNTGGTVIKSVTDAPIFTDRTTTAPNAQGTYEIDHIRFDGTSSTPVVLFNALYGTSSFHNCVIYQRGVGDGLKVIYGATFSVYENYFINKDYVTASLGVARTGIGFNYPLSYDSGLATLSKNSSRGWLTGYSIGGGAGHPYSTRITACESSTVYNGIILAANCQKTVIDSCYFEGGDTGSGILDNGLYTSIKDNFIFPGFSTLIDSSNTSTYGTVIEGNLVSLGAVVNSTGVKATCNSSLSIGSKSVKDNSIFYTAGTSGCSGLVLAGTLARITVSGNAFGSLPWTGAGSSAIVDNVSSGLRSLSTGINGTADFPKLCQGSVSFFAPTAALTQSDVTANKITLPDGSYFICSATGACSVLLFGAGTEAGRLVTFRTTTANMSFGNSAYNKVAGGVAFTGPGTITFLIDRIGADNYAWEISRTVF